MAQIRIQELAERMGISRTTVWKALHNRSGISDDLRKRILEQASMEGIIRPAEGESAKPAAHRKSIAVAVSRMESSVFWMNIIHHIAIELSKRDVDLVYTYLPSSLVSDYHLPGTFNEVSGIIVMNVYDAPLLRLISQLPVPKVFLDTVPEVPYTELTGDLVIIEGREAVKQITKRLIEKGKTRLGFVGDPYYAHTNSDRLSGFHNAHLEKGIVFNPRYSLIRSINMNSYYHEISAFIDLLPELPDAFVCASDFVAHYVLRRLKECGRKLPEGFTVTGFDNSAEFDYTANQITTADVQTAAIGRRLAHRILYLSEYPESSREVSYVVSNVIFRGGLENE